MKIKPIDGLEAKLAASEDAESLGDRHFALDLYDNEPALTLELEFTPKGTFVPAAALLQVQRGAERLLHGRARQ